MLALYVYLEAYFNAHWNEIAQNTFQILKFIENKFRENLTKFNSYLIFKHYNMKPFD